MNTQVALRFAESPASLVLLCIGKIPFNNLEHGSGGALFLSLNESTDRADGVVCQTEFSVSKSAPLNELSTNTGRRRVVSFSSPDRKSASLYLLPLVTTYD